jgi:ribose 5-phosphate isomerase A
LDDSFDELKKQAAENAVESIQDGMILGLGTGSTTLFAIRKIGELVNKGVLTRIFCIPSSQKTESQARKLSIPLTTLQEHPVIDITIDGADEVDPELNLIKGGGGALLREKIIAQASKRVLIIIDESKLSPRLGTRWSVPVEVIEFGQMPVIRYLESLGAKVKLRLNENGRPFRTDEGNTIVDCDFGPIRDLDQLYKALSKNAAIVESGLFLGLASEVIIAARKGIERLSRG